MLLVKDNRQLFGPPVLSTKLSTYRISLSSRTNHIISVNFFLWYGKIDFGFV